MPRPRAVRPTMQPAPPVRTARPSPRAAPCVTTPVQSVDHPRCHPCPKPPQPVSGTLMQGKRGLVMGVANDRSIAWGIAAACAAQGAELAFTYQGDALEKRVRPLAASVGSDLVFPCDVADDASIDAAFASLAQRWDKHRLRAPRHRLGRQGLPPRQIPRHPARGLPRRDGHLLLLLHRRRPARRADDAPRRLAAHPHLSRRRTRHAALQRHGRRQGRARKLGPLPRRRPRRPRASASTRSPPGR